jgi:hypothetical protein
MTGSFIIIVFHPRKYDNRAANAKAPHRIASQAKARQGKARKDKGKKRTSRGARCSARRRPAKTRG